MKNWFPILLLVVVANNASAGPLPILTEADIDAMTPGKCKSHLIAKAQKQFADFEKAQENSIRPDADTVSKSKSNELTDAENYYSNMDNPCAYLKFALSPLPKTHKPHPRAAEIKALDEIINQVLSEDELKAMSADGDDSDCRAYLIKKADTRYAKEVIFEEDSLSWSPGKQARLFDHKTDRDGSIRIANNSKDACKTIRNIEGDTPVESGAFQGHSTR